LIAILLEDLLVVLQQRESVVGQNPLQRKLIQRLPQGSEVTELLV
jgi:hypothetical protein